jgi:hypothetical protein
MDNLIEDNLFVFRIRNPKIFKLSSLDQPYKEQFDDAKICTCITLTKKKYKKNSTTFTLLKSQDMHI